MQGCFSMWKSSSVIYHINRMTRKRNDHLSNCRKAFDWIYHIVMIITLKKPRTEEKFFILIKYIYTTKTNKQTKNPIANTILNCEILNPFLPRWVRGEAKISTLNLYSNWKSLGVQGDQTTQSVKEINSEYSLEGLILKLKLQNFGHLIQRANSLKKTLMLGKTEGKREEGCRGWDG